MNIVVRWWLVVLLTIFVLRTVLVSRFGLDVPEIFWLWKEAVIFLLFICSVYVLFRRREIPDHGRWILSGGVVLLTVRSLYLAMVVHGQSLGDRAVFAKYDLMGRGVLLAGYLLVSVHDDWFDVWKWLERLITGVLVIGVLWWLVTVLSPGVREWLGYSMDAYQWTLDGAPPARYLTQVRRGYVRNGSIFGGPTSYGFRLIALGPWYVWKQLQRVSYRGWIMIALWVLNVALTYSRAAWGAGLVLVLLLFVLGSFHFYHDAKVNQKDLAKTKHTLFSRTCFRCGLWQWTRGPCTSILFTLIGGVLVGVGMFVVLQYAVGPADVPVAVDRDQGVLSRDLSDQGHAEYLQRGLVYVAESPVYGHGVGRAGPASYRLGSSDEYFNPENQYLQIAIELGIPGALMWFGLLGFVCILAWKSVDGRMLVLGVVGLGIMGLVLHSMMESMSWYSLMLVLGLAVGIQRHKFDRIAR